MVQIKPEEISAILRQQLSNFNASSDLEEVGTVLQVGDGIAVFMDWVMLVMVNSLNLKVEFVQLH
jgi:F0F1-type ATP synthase alpha subunit